jgi:hypothetical protein
MCFVQEEITLVFAMDCILWLSHKIEMVFGDGSLVKEGKSCIQITSLIVFERA